MAGRPELLSLAESVADGIPVDWEMLRTHAADDERPVIEQLRVLSNLIGLHRSLPMELSALERRGPGGGSLVPLVESRTVTPVLGSWGHLAVLERLGGGSFGEVYRAWDRQLEREVALKLMRGEASADDPRASRIALEGRMLARVRHPNVITAYGAAVNDGRVGLWMELVRGATLEQLLQERGSFGAREAALIGIDLCRALAALHAAGLIHRDVKAQNVMREDGGRIVLMDLGTGRPSGEPGAHVAADMAGTPLYLAPEIFDGGPAGPETDLYSLGVLMYRLVTGSFPVRAGTMDDLRAAHARAARMRLRDARADLPSAFVRVVDRATAADPTERYATAGALEADLVRTLDDAAPSPAVDRAESRRPAFSWRAALVSALVLAVVGLTAVLWRSGRDDSQAGPPIAPIRSVAVLPLVNLSRDPAQEYFADGMTDELIATLGRIEGIDVISRTSVMRFKGSTQPLPEIARALRVGAVLEASLLVVPADGPRSAGSKRIRITARLLRAGNEAQIWNRTFERELEDVLRLQSEIAAAVAHGVGVELLAEQAAAGTQPQRPDAFDLYLRGRVEWNRRTPDGLKRSLQYFREAIDRDPKFARAHAGLADAYSRMAIYGVVPRAEAAKQGDAAARTALKLDPTLGEAHASLALIQMERFEWDSASASFERAIKLRPGLAEAHYWYSAYLARRGRLPEALSAIERAAGLDPVSAGVSTEHGVILMLSRRYDDAIAQLERSLLLDANLARTHVVLAEAHAHKGDYVRALAETDRAAKLGDTSVELTADIGYIHAVSGRRDEAVKVAEQLAAQYASSRDGVAAGAATVYAGLRDAQRTFEWLERAWERRDAAIADLVTDPRFDSVRTDPRFGALLTRAGLSR